MRLVLFEDGAAGTAPGIYLRLLRVGYFESIDSERGLPCGRLAMQSFLGLELSKSTPDHITISRTWQPIYLKAHGNVFGWVPQMLAHEGLLKGNTIAIPWNYAGSQRGALRSIAK